MYVYIDTTHSVIIGVLNKELEWIEYAELNSKKSSEILHSKIYEQLSNHGLEIKSISGVIYSAGPGSYTGMRVSDGFTKILELKNIPIFSFYQFEVPNLVGINDGYWIDNAFKGEVFVYEWEDSESKHFRIKSEDLSNLDGRKLFSHEELLSDKQTSSTKKLIKDNSKKIFHTILQNKERKELFYYRSIDDEFQRKL